MRHWTFFGYVSDRGINEVEVWLDTLPPKAAAKVEWLLSFLQGVKHLKRPHVGVRNHYPDLYELVVSFGGVEYRPLGCYGPDLRQFTILVGATEKGGNLTPPNVEVTADHRRKVVLTDKSRTIEHGTD